MPPAATASPETKTDLDYVDVLIVGAGLSGIGAAHHLQDKLPGKTYAIVEARDAIGGTWDIFRYPGIRSDSDMQTLGYNFRPWTGEKAIADGPSILNYVRDTAAEAGIDKHIHFGKKVRSADWSTEQASWTVELEDTATGETSHATCGFLYACCGYYNYDRGFVPHFEGRERFKGQIVEPQFWPEDLDYDGKKVVIIGSGATAVTILPAMTDRAEHVTMLQRTPTYMITVPERDPIANTLRRLIGDKLAYTITRWKNVALTTAIYQLSQRRPKMMRKLFRAGVKRQLPEGYDMENFNPPYNPWDQRLCAVPDGDLFKAIRKGDASIVTDHIETFTENGIKLKSGKELEADIIITATGLDLIPIGNVEFAIDGKAVDVSEMMVYKGMMVSDGPNFVFTVGYTNASWTLKADLVAEYFCRLVTYMDERGYNVCMPVNDDPTVTPEPLLDFPAGYVLRAIDRFPKAGSKKPWRLSMTYLQDFISMKRDAVDDGTMKFETVQVKQPVKAAA